jgi:hypothetical protein
LCLTTIGNFFAWQMLGARDEVFPGRKKSLDVVWWSILPFCPIACPYALKFHSLNSLFSMLRLGASLHRLYSKSNWILGLIGLWKCEFFLLCLIQGWLVLYILLPAMEVLMLKC